MDVAIKRDMSNRMLGGVCAGLAKWLEQKPATVRIIFGLAWIVGVGIGWFGMPALYLILWLFLPKEGEPQAMKDAWNVKNLMVEDVKPSKKA